MENIIQSSKYKSRVSSVLNKNAKEYGKQFLFDGHEDTCWNSEQGSPQWVHLEFEEVQTIACIKIQFQGGFVGQECTLQACNAGEKLCDAEKFYPEDINAVQTFLLKNSVNAATIRILFNKSTDFFGRIIIYKLELLR